MKEYDRNIPTAHSYYIVGVICLGFPIHSLSDCGQVPEYRPSKSPDSECSRFLWRECAAHTGTPPPLNLNLEVGKSEDCQLERSFKAIRSQDGMLCSNDAGCVTKKGLHIPKPWILALETVCLAPKISAFIRPKTRGTNPMPPVPAS